MTEPTTRGGAQDIERTLRTRFGHAAFRPGQAEAIGALLAGRDALVIMPTGAGKSLVYQLASLHLPGTTLVISPLIALMQDQVTALQASGLRATYINSSLSSNEQRQRTRQMIAGAYDLVYVAPERLRSAAFLQALGHLSVGLLAVDEAHCISQWGHDFRPDYRQIARAAAALGHPTVVATTATATEIVQADIITALSLRNPAAVITGYDRPNLHYGVIRAVGVPGKLHALAHLLQEHQQCTPSRATIIYAGTRENAETAAALAREVCGLHATHYHAGLDAEARLTRQHAFLSGSLNTIAATNAFGMGIDRPDVGLVVHLGIPGTLEAYYQEAGRAGRDGVASLARLLYAPTDRRLQTQFIENDRIDMAHLRSIHDSVCRLERRRASRHATRITLSDLSAESHLSETRLRIGLQMLEQGGAVERAGDQGLDLALTAGPWDKIIMAEIIAGQEAHQQHRMEALETMVAYAETDDCRRRAILDHFGDRTQPALAHCCDNCDAPMRKSTTSALESLARRSDRGTCPEALRLPVLRALKQERWPIGREVLAGILRGAQSRRLIDGGYDQNPCYGALQHLAPDAIRQVIEALIGEGLVTRTPGWRPVLRVSAAGEALLHADAAAPADTAQAPASPPVSPHQSRGQPASPAPAGPDANGELAATLVRLRDPRPTARRLAVDVLGRRHDPAAVGPLMVLVSEAPSADLILAALRALRHIGGPTGRQALARVAEAPEHRAFVRLAARQELRTLDRSRPESATPVAVPEGGSGAAASAPVAPATGPLQPLEHDGTPDVGTARGAQDLGSEIEAFISRPHNQQLEGPWDLGWALDHHSRFGSSTSQRTRTGQSVYMLKYEQRPEAAEALRPPLAELFGRVPELALVDAIVPVPCTLARAVEPVAVLAGLAAALCERPVEPALIKTRQTLPQKELTTRAEKQRNVAGAFAVRGDVRRRVILVVDDLCDSGETLAEITRVLRRAGATRVYVLTATRTIHSEG